MPHVAHGHSRKQRKPLRSDGVRTDAKPGMAGISKAILNDQRAVRLATSRIISHARTLNDAQLKRLLSEYDAAEEVVGARIRDNIGHVVRVIGEFEGLL